MALTTYQTVRSLNIKTLQSLVSQPTFGNDIIDYKESQKTDWLVFSPQTSFSWRLEEKRLCIQVNDSLEQ